MKLFIHVLQASNLRQASPVLARVRVGKQKGRTRAVRGPDGPVWNEEFVFEVAEMEEEISVSVRAEEEGLFGVREVLGRVRVPVTVVLGEEVWRMLPTWFSLEGKGGEDRGKILLAMSLHGKATENCDKLALPANKRSSKNTEDLDALNDHPDGPSEINTNKSASSSEGKRSFQKVAGHFVHKLLQNTRKRSPHTSKTHDSPDISDISSNISSGSESSSESLHDHTFMQALELMQAADKVIMPEDLDGGVLVEQTFVITPKELNMFLFEPNSKFKSDLAALQGTTEYNEGPWTWSCEGTPCLKRTVTYTKAASKVVKSVKAVEEQTYLRADGTEFAVLTTVSTPDVPFGNCFRVELLFKITPSSRLSSGEESSTLVISWNINFFQSTMMKSVIEAGARQGLKDSYDQFVDLLCQSIKTVDSDETQSDKERLLAPLFHEHQSDWELAIEYFWNFTVVSTVLMAIYVCVHIYLSRPSLIQGLEFSGLDLPDTFGELFTSAILVLQGERVFNMISHFVRARLQRGSDHGIKARGAGWLLTVALIEGSNLPPSGSPGFADPFVVFTCNGKSRVSSVQLQTLDPQWNEIMEFDAMEEPPSVLDVEVYNFDGPFDLTPYVGHAQINFLKHSSSELADMWVPLEGKMAQASQSKLLLRIFLENTKGVKAVKEYLNKMEKEVGKKLNLHSPHRNSTFQKLFGLPSDEFLVNDFSCYLRWKIPLQGRLFVSARMLGFYSNIIGYKTKFFFLWEDIDDIQVVPPSLATVGSPSLLVTLRKGRGIDAQQNAKSLDEEGRLQFQFQSFVSFNAVYRTISALWRAKVLSPEHEGPDSNGPEDEAAKPRKIEDSEPPITSSEVNLAKVYSEDLQIDISSLMRVFDGEMLEQKVMEKFGCLSYTTTPWKSLRSDLYERQLQYKYNRHVSIFGGKVRSTQQKHSILCGGGWAVDEVMTFHDIPFGDHFQVHLEYRIATDTSVEGKCHCEVSVGVRWLKAAVFQKSITRNICEKLTQRVKEFFDIAVFEIGSG